jgi:hypothetical protein
MKHDYARNSIFCNQTDDRVCDAAIRPIASLVWIGFFRKCVPYEGSAHIPFIISGPSELGHKAGLHVEHAPCYSKGQAYHAPLMVISNIYGGLQKE